MPVVNIVPDHDAYVYSNSAGTNYVNDTIRLENYTNDKYSFMKWTTALILANVPAGATINSAVLYIKVTTSVATHDNVDHIPCDADWDESTITWTNKPAAAGASVGATDWTTTGWKTVTITSLFNSWHKGTANNYGIRIWDSTANASGTCIAAQSEDATPENRPYVAVTYTPVAGGWSGVSMDNAIF